MALRPLHLFGLLGVAILTPFISQIPGCVMSASPKSGRVINVETGQGMANVAVIAGSRFRAGVLIHGSVTEPLYETVTRTDANGNFNFPLQLNGIRVGMPGTSPEIVWVVAAFVPGYAILGDEESWSSYYPDGHAKFLPHSTAEIPKAKWFGVAEIEPIRMQKQELPARDWALYLSRILYFDIGTQWDDSEANELRAQGRDWIVPLLCKMNSNARLDYVAVSTIFRFAADTRATSRRMIELEPIYGDVGHREDAVFSATDACEAMKNIGAVNAN